MAKFGHLSWMEAVPLLTGDRVYFSFDPSVGLTDMDFHVITANGWKAMKSPGPDAVAEVEVAPQTTADQIRAVIDELSRRGGYTHIEIDVRG